MSRVIDIGEHRLSQANSKYRVVGFGKATASCNHRRATMDDNGEIIKCDDCGAQVSPYWFLRDFFERFAEYRRELDRQREMVNDALQRTVRLRAAQRVEKLWRSRKRMPACPHCHRGISQHDGFGSETVRRIAAVRVSAQKPLPDKETT